ncbi:MULTISPECIES: acetyl-CoA carboxylase, carboxyltransferase subunit beta [Acinetobacter]|uniref:Acetyl-coenzyme A carboxylase carboxyl transferase subunit beta n=1 Tax=Acinetobacter variabilis TaxID=70346 RepID=A0A7T7WJY7_9GAMM|nr:MULTISPECIES: acetyl-CoA carboxylase, carboxyltransferase subunit beta [Acinetobacter]MCU4365567.1 acetyl-CoA carboxylase, carboxyltransferase subunit beta [Acinetobacter variabilis]MCU4375470.1 acetyl-CoA carboxylase, carboxyltransferase subunit beta [Acinetobacter variabilis]NHB66324.1 acetyl-CoA carboxylase carboxyltransferase subunit beta [Acinetobacter sp. GFQ9D191M]NHC01989.1 acetyl-CoA carboxylase carboxyltransferase subunit beta [Acinetobacter sp. GFQ9D192M]QKW82116.1 acetyl-CoA car
MSQQVKSGKILSPSTPWTERIVPGIHVPDEQTTLKATFTEPTIECPECHALVTRTAMSFNAYVCPQCDEHLKMKARDRLNWFFDQVQTEMGQEFTAKDPLKFVDSKAYPDRMSEAQKKTGETEALIVMQGLLKGVPMIATAFEFDFMGGSMGTVVGDRFVQAAERAIEMHQPLICFAASGGARMQEGMLSLMQMARTSAAIQRLKEAGLPYVVVLTHPVYGGVTASLAMLGDVHLAEPKAMIGFAGKRVIEQTVREKLDEPFQRAEYLLDHGVIDQIVHRHALRDTVYRIITKLMNLP